MREGHDGIQHGPLAPTYLPTVAHSKALSPLYPPTYLPTYLPTFMREENNLPTYLPTFMREGHDVVQHGPLALNVLTAEGGIEAGANQKLSEGNVLRGVVVGDALDLGR